MASDAADVVVNHQSIMAPDAADIVKSSCYWSTMASDAADIVVNRHDTDISWQIDALCLGLLRAKRYLHCVKHKSAVYVVNVILLLLFIWQRYRTYGQCGEF